MAKSNKTKWIPTDKRFVAFFDILGFKDMVMRSTHNEIYDKLNEISRIKKWLEKLTADDEIQEKVGNAEIYTVSFSDSIVLFSKNGDSENFRFFLVAVRWFLAKAIENDIPMKGGMAYGQISLNKSEQIYFGQPIIDAYLIEEDVYYFGVTAHNSINNYINQNHDSLDMKYINEILFDCLTPLKCGKVEHTNVNWFIKIGGVMEMTDKDEKKKIINETIKKFRMTASGSPRKYVDNTLHVLKNIIIV
ncbi:hypothetical protein [Flavobacterium litorale]|uniref:Guanylate cyclase domain-containing protein n=1 Tax=Flavobacterium litorale TaxID=2856519 RepID=A0ABX8V897_9FLAO|nr:hypothetical protein [Flavobacterium litorale]QYJ69046.1 hypothetical protein K1I41_03930 [Flavobacterium litorale]